MRLLLAVLLAPLAWAQVPILEIQVTGNQRLPTAGIVAASGLRLRQPAGPADFNAAMQKLIDTGFFRSANYRYEPRNDGATEGYALTLEVVEEHAVRSVQLDIPEVDSAVLWRELKQADPFVTETMPDNAPAVAYYQRAIETALRTMNHAGEIVMKNEADLKTRRMVAIFLPANLPKVGSLQFEGARGVPAAALEAAVKPLAIGEPYSDHDFRRLVELNLRPIYEEKGFLTVAFPGIQAARLPNGTMAVTTVIEEGTQWTLGKVSLKGDGLPEEAMWRLAKFPTGRSANWAQILESIQLMTRVLRDDGYLRVSTKPVRTFHDSDRVVDVTVEIAKGPQFVFGSLALEGLDAGDQDRAMKMWKVPAGAVLNSGYIDEYLRDAFKQLSARPRSVSRELRPRPGSNIIDLTLKFK